MRSVSAIAAVVTPRSAARAKSGRTAISGRTRRRWTRCCPAPGWCAGRVSTARAAAASACRVVAGQHQDVLLARAAEADLGAHARQLLPARSRMRCSITCLRTGRSPRPVSSTVSVALRTSPAPCGANGSAAGRCRADRRVDAAHVLDRRPPVRAPAPPRRASAPASNAGRQLHVDLGLRVVVGRDEAGGQQRDQQRREPTKNARATR